VTTTTVRIPAGAHPQATLACRLEGPEDAPAVTMLHSLASNGGLWDEQAAALAQCYRVLRIDLRGHGSSSGDGDNYDIELLASDVIAVWDALGIEHSAIVGLSLGGMLALHIGLHTPERTTCIVAADCRSDAPPMFVALWDGRQHLLCDEGITAVAEATLPTWLTLATIERRSPLVARIREMIMTTSHNGYMGATRALQRLALREDLPRMTRPVRYIVGALDGIHPPAMRDMAAATPGADLVEIPEASHLSNLEQPDAFLAALEPFLAAHVTQGNAA
jgi:3-oxoadipate enol-lactonase